MPPPKKSTENNLFFTTVLIRSPALDGDSIGTAFFYRVDAPDVNGDLELLVTNKHVLDGDKGVFDLVFHKLNEEEDGPDFLNPISIRIFNIGPNYYEHPDSSVDLACINVGPLTGLLNEHGATAYRRHVAEDDVVDCDHDAVRAGFPVSFIGYPAGRYDPVHQLPIMRHGHIASIPTLNYDARRCFMLDAEITGGSSGSPVLIAIEGKARLLGVVERTLNITRNVWIEGDDKAAKASIDMGLGTAVKAECVRELGRDCLRKMLEIDDRGDPIESAEAEIYVGKEPLQPKGG